MSNEGNAHSYGFIVDSSQCEVRVYKHDGILTYSLHRDGEMIGERHIARDNEREKQLVERMMQMMGANLIPAD